MSNQPLPYSDQRDVHRVEFIDDTGQQEFRPKKPGDVGHDMQVVITGVDQKWYDRLLSALLGWPAIVIWPVVGQRVLRSCLYISMPDALWCEIRPRSSTSRKQLQVIGGTIDSGYQGELYTVLHNFGFLPRVIRAGERYAQVVFHPAVRPALIKRGTFFSIDTERGETGFGSTGR